MAVRVRSGGLVLAVLACLTVVAAGCGSDDDSGAGASGGGKDEFVVGYSIPTGQNPWINAIRDAAEAKIKAAGGRMVVHDAQLDPNKAVTDVQDFVDQGVDAIVIAPAQVPQSLTGALAKAKAAEIPVIGFEWDFATDPASPPKGVDAQVIIDRKGLAEDVMARIARDTGGSANVAYVGLPFPVTSLDTFYAGLQEQAKAIPGLELVDRVDNPKDNAEGARPVVASLLTKRDDLDAIVTYSGPTALGAAQAVAAAGRTGDVRVYNIQLDTPTAKALRGGTLAGAWDLPPVLAGEELGTLAVAAARDEPAADWRKTVVIDVAGYDKQTLADWKDWAKAKS